MKFKKTASKISNKPAKPPINVEQINELIKDMESVGITADKILDLHEEYKFSSDKITGIIKRAEDKEMIEKVSRGVYKLNMYLVDEKKYN